MNTNVREQIVKKIEAKRTAIAKIVSKPENIEGQIAMYRKAIADHEAKIEMLKERIEKFEAAGAESVDLHTQRQEELKHMEQILATYDVSVEERDYLSEKMTDMIEAMNWMPGDDPALRGAGRKDPKFIEIRNRKLYLDEVINAALPDVRKIYVSRGEVSTYHTREES